MRAIEYIREKRKRSYTNAIYEHLKKTEESNIDKETIGNIISELINQKILENKLAYGDSFRLITDKENDTLDEITSPDNIDNVDKNDNQSDPGININTQKISPIRELVINLDVHNPLTQPIREREPVTNPDLHSSLPSNKKDHFQHDKQQIIKRLEAQISALKSHLKCEVSTMNSRIDLLSEVIENKVNVLSDQCKNFEVLQDNTKFLQMKLKTKNEIVNNLLDTQSAIVESLSLAKQQNSHATSLAKQQTKTQGREGGALIEFVKKGLMCKKLKIFEPRKSECICSEITMSKKKWLCFSIYRPSSHDNLELFFDKLTRSLSKASESYENFIVIGGFNIDVINKVTECDKLDVFCDLFNLT